MTILRPVAGALVRQLQLPLGSLGLPLVGDAPDAEYAAAIAQWWASLAEQHRTPTDVLATLAAPVLVAEIRAMFSQRTLLRTYAITGSVEAGSPWLLAAHHETTDELEVEHVTDRSALVNTLCAWLEGAAPVWEAAMRFKLGVDEFAVLLALADLHSRAAYSSLITHGPPPATYTTEQIHQAWKNGTEVPDPRYLFPFAAPMLAESVLQMPPAHVLALAGQLAAKGLLEVRDAGYAWTDSGLFLAESLHRRSAAVAIQSAAANPDGSVGIQCSLFVRSDQPLWYFGIDRNPAGEVVVAGITADITRGLLDEILKPLGVPPLQADIERMRQAAQAPLQPVAPAPAAQRPVFCGNCGAQLGGGRFCAACGTPVPAL